VATNVEKPPARIVKETMKRTVNRNYEAIKMRGTRPGEKK